MLSCVAGSVLATSPISRALPVEVTGNKNSDTIVPLMANVPIPDNGELNWPINVVDLAGITVVDLRVELYGFWHEHASDLRFVTSVIWLHFVARGLTRC